MKKYFKKYIKDILISSLIAILIILLSKLIESDYLIKFFDSNLVILQIGVLAVNIGTGGIIIAKLKEIEENLNKNIFEKTYKSIELSIYEQILIIIFTILSFILFHSKIEFLSNTLFNLIMEIFITLLFFMTIFSLIDTTKALINLTKIPVKLFNKSDKN